MNKVEKILEEIKRIEGILDDYSNTNKNIIDNGIVRAKRNILEHLKSFINTLPEEPESADLEDEIDEEIDNLCESGCYPLPDNIVKGLRKFARHFAEWQEKKDEENFKASWNDGYEVGRADGGEEVFQDAADAKVVGIGDTTCINTLIQTESKIESLNLGDKVKVIYKKF